MPPPDIEDGGSDDPLTLDLRLETKYRENPSEAMRSMVRYRQAQLWSSIDDVKACALWLQISNRTGFPLYQVARLRAIETCPVDQGEFPSIEELVEGTPQPWLKENLLRAALNRAIRTGDRKWEMYLSAELTRFERSRGEKVERLQRSIEIAKELNDSAALESYTAELESVAPRFIADPTDDQLMKVAMDFRYVRDFDKAREIYGRAVKSSALSDNDKLRALHGIRMTYKLERNIDKYLEATREYSKFARRKFFTRSKSRRARARLHRYFDTQITLARAIWTDNSSKEAEKILIRAERDLKRRIPVEDSVLIRARIKEEAGQFKEAVRILDGVNLKRVASRSTRQKILWYKAWNLRKIGRTKEAVDLLDALKNIEDSPSLSARNRFWLARSLMEIGNTDRAKSELEWLIENDPLGYYGFLAYRELKRPIPGLGPASEQRILASEKPDIPPIERIQAKKVDLSDPNAALTPEDRLTAEWLLAVKEHDLVRRFLDHVSSDKRSGFTDAQAIDLLKLYARSGSYQTLFSRLYDLPPEARDRVVQSQPDLIFPQPWKPVVKDASEKFNVPVELIYSIMRQESSFNPMARSPADAFGLMQLIPENAARTERATGIRLASHEDLFKPDTNVPLGTAFLRELLNKWQEQFVLTVASYNASEKAIAGWIRTRFRGDPLVFIEDIPYEETRTYIKLVLRNYIFYSRLNSGGQPIEFPEQCLENLQAIKL